MSRIEAGTMLALAATVFAGCSSTPLTPPAASTAPAVTTSAAKPAASGTEKPVDRSTVATVNLPSYLDPNSLISKERSVYFDFDDFTIKTDYAPLIERQGRYLSSKPALAIKIEGNADERGGAEYNLSLGQKRAESVLKSLKLYGVKDSQMEAVSWGEGHPEATGHDEEAWAKNRRADLSYPKQ